MSSTHSLHPNVPFKTLFGEVRPLEVSLAGKKCGDKIPAQVSALRFTRN